MKSDGVENPTEMEKSEILIFLIIIIAAIYTSWYFFYPAIFSICKISDWWWVVAICLFRVSERKCWQEVRSEACRLRSVNKISGIPATNTPGWSVYEDRGVWGEKKAQ